MDKDLKYTLSLKDLFSKGMDKAVNSTQKLDSKMDSLKSKLSGIGTAVVAAFSVAAVIGFGKSVIDSLKNFEYFSASLKTLLWGDAAAAKALNSQLIDLAKTTPFSLVEVQNASKQLLAYGFKAGEIVKTMRTLGDVASGVGAPIGDIAYLFGTLKTQGRAFTKDIREFTGRGIPIIAALAKQFHVTEGEVTKLVESGKIGFPEVEKAFNSMTSAGGQFFGMMDAQSKTVGGQLSNMGDSWEQLKVNIGKSQTGIINSTVSFVSSMLSSLNDLLAASNRIDETLTAAGLKTSTWIQEFNDKIGLGGFEFFSGDLQAVRDFDTELQSIYKTTTKLQTAQSLSNLNSLLANEYRQLIDETKQGGDGLTTKKEIALVKARISEVGGALRNFDSTAANKGTETNVDATGGKTPKSIGSGTESTGSRPQSLIINITKLVEQLTISTTNLKESASAIKEEVAKALLEAVNDVNMIAR